MDPDVLLRIFSGESSGSSGISMGPFVNALHIAFWAGVAASILGAGVSLLRGEHRSWEAPATIDR